MAEKNETTCASCGHNAASFLLRLWIGLRLFFAGLEKFRAGSGVEATYNMSNYKEKMGIIAQGVADNSFLPKALCNAYAFPLGFLLLIVGIWVLLGIAHRFSLLVAGLLFVSLAFGVMVLPDDTQSLYLGLHVAICAYALTLSKYDWLSLGWLLNRKKG